MNFWAALAIYLILMSCYWFFAWSIFWHVREYTFPSDRSRLYIGIFFIISGVLSVVSFISFFMLPLKF